MFRFLMLAVALGLSAGVQRQKSAYSPNKEYWYDYETQVVTGIPRGSKIYSGLKFKATAKLQFETAVKVMVRWENVEMYKINDMIDGIDPTRQQIPEDLFQQLTGPETADMAEKLAMPVKFSYIRGHVSDLHSNQNDPHWSMDVKRGFISLLEVNLDGRQSLDTPSPISYDNQISPGQSEFYTVLEPSVAGECETFYRRMPLMTSEGGPSMRLNKIRNYNKCVNRPSFTNTMFNEYICAECEKDRTEPLRSTSEVYYYLRGMDRSFIIESAIAESKHIYTQYSEEGGSVATFINQTLMLTNTKMISEPMPPLQNPKSYTYSLRSETVDMEDPREQHRSFLQDDSQIQFDANTCEPAACTSEGTECRLTVEQQRTEVKIQKLLNSLSAFTEHEIQEEATSLLANLMVQLRHADYRVLLKFWTRYGKPNTDPAITRIRKILIDMMPAAGTPASAYVLATAIEGTDLTQDEAAVVLKTLTISSLPDICVAKWVQKIVELPLIEQHRPAKIAAWLCMGSVVNKINTDHRKKMAEIRKEKNLLQKVEQAERPGPIKRELRQKLAKYESKLEKKTEIISGLKEEFVQMLQTLLRSTAEEDNIMALKAIGNAGFVELIPDLKNIIYDKSKSYILRSQAMFAFRKIIHVEPEVVRNILLPRYFDRSEPEPIRIVAFLMFFIAHPPRPMLEMAVKHLDYESNPNIGTFVYSLLEQYSNSSNPCLMSMAKNASWAMHFAKKYPSKYHYSRYMQSSMYDDKRKGGMRMDLEVLSSPKEFIPTSVNAEFRANALGRQIDFIAVGYNSEGIQQLLNKLMGPYSLWKEGKSPLDILEPQSHSGSYDDSSNVDNSNEQSNPIRDLHRQLTVSPRQTPHTEGHIYIKAFGNEITYIPIDYKFIERLLRQGKIHVPVSEEDLRVGTNLKLYKSMVLSDVTHMFASEAGFPIRMSLHGSTFMKVEGTFSVTATPALFKKNRYDNQLGKLDAAFNIHPSAVMEMEGNMMVDAFYFKSGAAVRGVIQAESPLNFNYGYDAAKNKFYSNFDVSNLKEKLMKLEMKPFTFVRKEPFDIHHWPTLLETKDIDVAENAILETVSKEYGNHEFGLKFAMNGQRVSRNFLPSIPYCPFSGKQMVYLTVAPGINPPAKYQLDFVVLRNRNTDAAPLPDQNRDQGTQNEGYLRGYFNLLNVFSYENSPVSTTDENTPNIYLQHLIEKLRGKVPIWQDGKKYGYSLKLTGIGSHPPRYINIEALFQKNIDEYERRLSFLVKRSPFPQWETEPSEWDMDFKMTYPRVHVKPSKLIDPSYLEELEKQIELYVEQDGKFYMKHRIHDILPAYQDMMVTRMQSLTNSRTLIDDLVMDMVKKTEDSADPVLRKLIKVAGEQQNVLSSLKQLKQKIYDKKNLKEKEMKYMSFIHRAKRVADILNQQLSNVQGDNADIRKALLVKYSVYKQQEVLRNMLKMYSLLKDMLPDSVEADMKDHLKVAEIQLYKMVQKQGQVLLPESQNPPMPDLKQGELKVKQERLLLQLLSPSTSPRLEDVTMLDVQDVISKASIVERKLNGAIVGETDIPKPVLYEIFEAVIFQKQVVESMKIKMELVKQQVMDGHVQGMQPDIKQTCVAHREAMKSQAFSLSKILGHLISKEEEYSILSQIIPSTEHQKLYKLFQVKLLQPLIVEKLEKIKGKTARSVPRQDDERLPLFQECMQHIQEIKRQLQHISDETQMLSPQLVHMTAKMMQTQVKLLEQLKENVHKWSLYQYQSVMSRDRQPLTALRNNIEDSYLDQLKKMKKVMSLVEETDTTNTDYDSIPQSPRVSRVVNSKTFSRNMQYPQRLYFEMTAHVGSEHARTKAISIEMIGKKSLAQIFWEKDQSLPVVRDAIVKQYLSVKNSGAEDVTKASEILDEELNTFRHFHFSINYYTEAIPEYLQLYFWRYREFLKFEMFHHMRQYFPKKSHKPNYMELIMDIERNNYQVNMDMLTPHEVDRFRGILMPFSWQSFLSSMQPKPFRNSILPSPLRITNKLPGICKIRENVLKTLDAHEYTIPDSKGCNIVLAMDCSSSSEFAIKARKVMADPVKKVVEIMIKNKKIEVIPRNNNLVVKVDDVKLTITDNSPYVIKKDEQEGRHQPVLIEIVKRGPHVYVHVPIQGTQVVTDGEMISIQVSPFYYSKVCGLCGNYDGNPSNDNKDPQKQTHKDPACLLASYVTSHDQCEAEDVKRECSQAFSDSIANSASCRLEKKTEVRTKLDNICFSVRPVDKCVSGCRPQQQKPIRMPMICKDRRDPQSEVLRQASHQRVLTELRDQAPTDYLRILQDESCL
uniref:Vitellogenin n=1 Tax=Azumapecten farreri TaxID=106299 RepID=F1A7R8_AZUFA|nr:vitellogenin [Azumapecten farreri]